MAEPGWHGPFELTDWVEGSSLTWTKNPDYWGTDEKYPQNRLPYIDTLRSLIMKDEASRLAVLRSGKVDYIGANAGSNINTPDVVESIERTHPDLKIWPYYFRSNAGMTYNLTNPPYSDIRLRKALQMDGLSCCLNPDYFEIVRDYWRKIGVESKFDIHEPPTWASRANGHEFEGMTWSTAAGPYSPLSHVLRWYTTGHPFNRGQVDDPQFNALFASMEAAQTMEEVGKYSKQADMYMISQHWQLWGPVEPAYNVTQPWVKGHNGEYYMGAWNWNAVYVRLWIDQELKKEMGF